MRRLLVGFLAVIICLSVVGCGQDSSPESSSGSSNSDSEVVTIKMAGHMPVGQTCTIASEKFQEAVEEKSNGTIKFDYYPAGQLAQDMKAYELVKSGGIDMAEFFVNRASGIIPEAMLFEVSGFETADAYARRMYDKESGGGIFFDLIKPGFIEQGLYVMPGFLYSPEHSTITTKPVNKLEDYQGLKIRCAGKGYGMAVEAWGAVPVVMSSADVYTALQRGTIDGAKSGLASFVSRKWYEVADYVQYTHELAASLDIIVNLDFWESLTSEQQDIIKESLREAVIWSYEQSINEVDEYVDELKARGLDVVDWMEERPEELDKMREVTFAKFAEELPSIVGEEAWNEFERAFEATREGERTWKDVMESIEF